MKTKDEGGFDSDESKIERLTGIISIFSLAHKINKMRKGEVIIIDGGKLKVGDQNT